MLSSTCSEAALSERTFQRFKSGDFDVEDKQSGGKEKIPNWSHYLLTTRARRKKNCQNHWE